MNDSSALRPAGSAGLSGVARALRRALVSQLHPRMLFALLMPFLITLAGAVVLIWLCWDPVTAWLQRTVSDWAVVAQVDEWLIAAGLVSLKLWLVPLAAVAILLPVAGILGLAIAAVCVMPMVLNHLEARDYAGLKRQGRHGLAVGMWNAIWVTTVFALGWLVTLPLWLLPPMALVLPVFWWAFAFSRMMRVDALVEHASPAERRLLEQRHNAGFWTLGFILALGNLLPPAWLVLPVFSALVFAHYGLDALARLRQETVIDV